MPPAGYNTDYNTIAVHTQILCLNSRPKCVARSTSTVFQFFGYVWTQHYPILSPFCIACVLRVRRPTSKRVTHGLCASHPTSERVTHVSFPCTAIFKVYCHFPIECHSTLQFYVLQFSVCCNFLLHCLFPLGRHSTPHICVLQFLNVLPFSTGMPLHPTFLCCARLIARYIRV